MKTPPRIIKYSIVALSFFISILMYASAILFGMNTVQVAETSLAINAAPVWSPSGSWIAFVSNRSGNYDLWLINSDGTQLMNVTAASKGNEASPIWLPNGQQIAFTSDYSDQASIWLIDKDGSDGINLTGTARRLEGKYNSRPRISPDGRLISFSSEDSGVSDMILMSLNDYHTRNLTADLNQRFTWSAWSPDSSRLAFTSSFGQQTSGLWVLSLEHAWPTKIVSNLQALTLAWSPTGEKLAFTALSAGELYLYSVNVDGSDLQRLMKGSWPVWTPDGQQIVFESIEAGASDIWIMGRDGSAAHNLTHSVIPEAISPSISPDGGQIAFVSNDGTNQAVWIMNIDGTRVRKLVQ